MRSPRLKLICVALAVVLAASSALAAEMSPDAINAAEPSKKSLSKDKATPAGVRLQVLLDRAHFSPGEAVKAEAAKRRATAPAFTA